MSTTVAAGLPTGSRAKHPFGLYVLFGTEMWERLSYYGMRALLVLYLTNHLDYARPDALKLYAIYTGLVYLTPLLGGFLADQVLGQRKAVFLGGCLMALGHFAMAFQDYLYYALGLIILGNGFFKPNVTTMVGQQYPSDDPRRDNAYTIFYMGINTGAFLAPIVCGTLGERVGWHWGFGAAGVGMILGLINFGMFQGSLGTQGFPPGREGGVDARLKPIDFAHVAILTAIGVGLVYAAVNPAGRINALAPGLFVSPALIYWILLAGVMVAATYFVAGGRPTRADGMTSGSADDASAPFTSAEWQRVGVILVVSTFSILFWMAFEQAGGTFTLFADKKTDRALPMALQGALKMKEFPASWYQTINPLMIVLLAPFPLMVWSALDRAGIRVNSAAKMGIGLVIVGLGFIFMEYADRSSSEVNRAGPGWLAIVYVFNSVGELCLSPIGLSLVNSLAPKRISSLMMAIWFLCTAVANYLAGTLEHLLSTNYPDLNLFNVLIYTSIIPGLVLLAISPLLKKMSHGRL